MKNKQLYVFPMINTVWVLSDSKDPIEHPTYIHVVAENFNEAVLNAIRITGIGTKETWFLDALGEITPWEHGVYEERQD